MQDRAVYNEPIEVSAEDGNVVLKGPNDIDLRMSPDAAEETAERLMENALKARGQSYFTRDESR